MEKNEEQDVDLENNEGDLEEEDESEKDLSARLKELESEAAKWKRIAQQRHKKLSSEKSPDSTLPKPGELDYAQKAFLRAEGIRSEEETSLVQSWLKNTGKPLDEIVDSKYFQAELKDLRDAQKSKEATPKGSGRDSSAHDQVSYLLAKVEAGEMELNDIQDYDTRVKVLEARKAKHADSNLAERIMAKQKA